MRLAREAMAWRWRGVKWRLADWLSYFACKLRGQVWYEPDTFAGVPGNRAADLQQSLWEDYVVATIRNETRSEGFEGKLSELATLAGAQWGHIWPEGSPGYRKPKK